MQNSENKLKKMTIRLEEDVMQIVLNKAKDEDIEPAVYVRNLIKKCLLLDFTAQQRDAMEMLLREIIRDELKPQSDRLATLSAKSGIMAAASFFILKEFLTNVYGENVDVEDLAATSRRSAAEYVRGKPE